LKVCGRKRSALDRHQHPGLFLADLQECGAVKIEWFTDAALGALNFAVNLVGGRVTKCTESSARKVSNLESSSNSG
jgi:hypothetical protein